MDADELIAAVEALLGDLAPVYKDFALEADLYEASLFAAAAVDAVRRAGGTISFRDTSGNPTSELRFRRSPGNLWSGDFTHAHGEWPLAARALEVHLGIYVAGSSGVAHECDVVLLDFPEALRSRAGAVHPRRSGVVGAVEAKFYSASPGIGVGRNFIGLGNELGQAKTYLAFPAAASTNLAALMAKKPGEAFDEVIPGRPSTERLRSHLEQRVRNWLSSR